MVTSIYAKSDLKAQKFIDVQYYDGIKVSIINVFVDNKQGFLKRTWSFIAYAIVSSFIALIRRPDVTIASSGPITVGLPGLLSKWFHRSILVFEVRDLWPEGAIELGVIKNSLLIGIARWFEKVLYQNSKLIVGLSPGMKSYIEAKHGHPNVISITNSANLNLFGSRMPYNNDTILKEKYAIYTGNIGEVNNSFWLLNACRLLKQMNREDIFILLVGDGQQKDEICEIAKSEDLKSFEYRGLMPKEELIVYIQNALVSIVPLKGTPVLDTSSPNKFFESLAAGVPIIQNTNGWMKEYLRENEVGFTLPPDDPELLALKLIELADNVQNIAEMKAHARMCAERDFDQEKLATRYLHALTSLLGR